MSGTPLEYSINVWNQPIQMPIIPSCPIVEEPSFRSGTGSDDMKQVSTGHDLTTTYIIRVLTTQVGCWGEAAPNSSGGWQISRWVFTPLTQQPRYGACNLKNGFANPLLGKSSLKLKTYKRFMTSKELFSFMSWQLQSHFCDPAPWLPGKVLRCLPHTHSITRTGDWVRWLQLCWLLFLFPTYMASLWARAIHCKGPCALGGVSWNIKKIISCEETNQENVDACW